MMNTKCLYPLMMYVYQNLANTVFTVLESKKFVYYLIIGLCLASIKLSTVIKFIKNYKTARQVRTLEIQILIKINLSIYFQYKY